MASWNPRVNEIFLAAVEAASPAERAAIVQEACGADPDLRAKVEALLRAHEQAGTFLDPSEGAGGVPASAADPGPTLAGDETRPGSGTDAEGTDPDFEIHTSVGRATATAPRPVAEGPGTRIGPYRLLQKIGEGGMGSVYMAEQEVPVRRRVALKIIKPGMDSEQVIRRFEAERQALALMDHPGIARVLDAGATESGRPYFVMELVNGMPITEYCDRERLGPKDRLALFARVCQAVQHAHQKGIIHRDLKPSNILVTLIDGQPVPKVIDFGIAKAIDQRLTERTLFTQFGGIVGTLEYMSPEQAALSGVDIDTRSDIYSLGVLLYELLTGTTPLSRQRLHQAGYIEILRQIREVEPPPPSSRLSQSTETLPSVSAQRNIEPARLTRLVRGELDWIVMKALDKDRGRRYETANGLARDIERYLADEPVEAGPPSARYRLGKLLRKHRTLVATAAAFAGLLLVGAVVSSYLAVRAKRAERAALQAADQALRAEREATDQRDKARAAEAESRAVSEFLQNDLLAQASSQNQVGRGSPPDPEIKVRTLLDRAAARIGQRFRAQPLIEAATRRTIGMTYSDLGLYRESIAQLTRSLDLLRRNLGGKHVDTLRAAAGLARQYQETGDFGLAEPLTLEAVRGFEREAGAGHTLAIRARRDLAVLHARRGRYREAEQEMKRTFDLARETLGESHNDTLWLMENLGHLYRLQGRLEEAQPLLERCLELRRQTLEDIHPDTMHTMTSLGMLYLEQNRVAEAERLMNRTVELCRKALGREHDLTLEALNLLAGVYWKRARHAEAEKLLAEILAVRRVTQGEDHPTSLMVMGNLGILCQAQGKNAEALGYYRKTLELRKRRLGESNPDTLGSVNGLAWLLAVAPDPGIHNPDEAIRLTREAVGHATESMSDLAGSLWSTMSLALYQKGDGKAALDAARKANELHREQNGEDWLMLALAHARLGQHHEARQWLDRATPWLKENRSHDPDFNRLLAEAESALAKLKGSTKDSPGKPPAGTDQPKSPVRG